MKKLETQKKKLAQKMINGTVKSAQKGKGSLESVQNNKTMLRAGNEHNRP